MMKETRAGRMNSPSRESGDLKSMRMFFLRTLKRSLTIENMILFIPELNRELNRELTKY